MSTREQRRSWQEFREKHGSTPLQFQENFRRMFQRDPNSREMAEFLDMKRELRAPLGRRKVARLTIEGLEAPSQILQPVPAAQPQHVTATRRFEWDMGHRLPHHKGKCSRLHGHRYVAEVDITGALHTAGSSTGMVIDFGDIDAIWQQLDDLWDHRTMLHKDDPLLLLCGQPEAVDCRGAILEDFGAFAVSFIPTAENIAREILRWLSDDARLPEITRVRVYETPRSWAEVRRE